MQKYFGWVQTCLKFWVFIMLTKIHLSIDTISFCQVCYWLSPCQNSHCTQLGILTFALEREGGQLCNTLFIYDCYGEDCCLSSISNKHSVWHSMQCISVECLLSLQCIFIVCAAGMWASNSPVSQLFIRLSWSDARLRETSPAPGLPAVLKAPGRRYKHEDLGDLLSVAVTWCLKPASYRAQQPDSDRGLQSAPGRGGGGGFLNLPQATTPHQFRDCTAGVVKML